ncbi:MAG: hypothetical protein UW55_C0042G0007, partial [Candidatus Giovannonibacteria bacterium GW2011_GWA2_44_26]
MKKSDLINEKKTGVEAALKE